MIFLSHREVAVNLTGGEMKPYYEHEGITIYHGDCRDILPMLEPVDLVLTDPPYGNNTDYGVYEDSESNLRMLINQLFVLLLPLTQRKALTCGVANISKYPEPKWILSWVTPAGAGSGPWGFCCWQPILVYGADPYLRLGMGRRPDTIIDTETSEKNGHPCPKP